MMDPLVSAGRTVTNLPVNTARRVVHAGGGVRHLLPDALGASTRAVYAVSVRIAPGPETVHWTTISGRGFRDPGQLALPPIEGSACGIRLWILRRRRPRSWTVKLAPGDAGGQPLAPSPDGRTYRVDTTGRPRHRPAYHTSTFPPGWRSGLVESAELAAR